jgi:hypothetical protein
MNEKDLTADVLRKRAEVKRIINSSVITPMSGEAWKKTDEEKRELKLMKKLYKAKQS